MPQRLLQSSGDQLLCLRVPSPNEDVRDLEAGYFPWKAIFSLNSSSGLNHYFGKAPFFNIRFPWGTIGDVLSGLRGALVLSEFLLGR